MSGSLRMLREENEDEAGKHDHVDLVISNGMILRYTDPRRFGAWLWCEDLATSSVLAHLGPEPLSEVFNGDYLYEKSRNKRTLIKPWLMDNKLVVGVGNIYASESLFSAGILPDRPAGSLEQSRSGTAGEDHQGGVAAFYRAGRHDIARLFAVGRQTGVFRTGAAGLRAGGRTVPRVRHADRIRQARAAQHLLLPPLPALSITRRRASPSEPG